MIESTWAVVVNLDGGERNLACVRSLVAEGIAPERIVFVDNGSSDGSVAALRAAFGGVRCLCNERNLGYGFGSNRGIREALERGAEFLFLVNNDVTLAPGMLARLLEALGRERALGIVGPRVLYPEPSQLVWCAGGLMTYRQNLSTLIGHRRPDGPEYHVTREVDYVAGCAMLVKRAVFERAGLLDGDFFGYHEDVDFCLRARAAGFGVRLVGDVACRHAPHSTTGGGYNPRRKYMMGVNTVWFLRRHGTPARWLSFLAFDVLTLPAAWAYRALRGEGGAVLAKARGTLDGLRGRRVDLDAVLRAGREEPRT
jgi:GT2 family glycosyltransferase